MNRLVAKLEKIKRDPIITAKAVGLRYCVDCRKGYYRIRTENGFQYIDQDHKKLRDKKVMQRIISLVIPPAWEHVWVSPHENGHLQATGIDIKGRKQYRYHPQWNKIRNQAKFHRLGSFATALPAIREHVEKDLSRKGLPYEKVVALVVKLIELTHIRIGNEAYKKLYGSFGLSTLQDKHVRFSGPEVYFNFTGKKGIKHKISIRSKRLANLVRKCKDIPGQDLFQYYDDDGQHHTIGSADVNIYLKKVTGEDFTAKDFRAWAGSVTALEAFQQLETPQSQADCKRKTVLVLDTVAAKLGNTRTVCKKYYVHPTVIAAFERGSIWNYGPENTESLLHAHENALVRLLENEKIAEVIG